MTMIWDSLGREVDATMGGWSECIVANHASVNP